MPLESMTGFARADAALGPVRWHWELRSVNGRGLDMRMRLPQGSEALEAGVRERIAKRITRGNLSIALTVQSDAVAGEVRINERALATVLAALARIEAAGDFAKPGADGILALRGVLELDEAAESEADREMRIKAMLASFDQALDGLVAARHEEGARLEPVLEGHLAAVERIVATVAAAPGRSLEAIRGRLAEQVRRLVETGAGLDPERLHQEAALIATRIDVEEELKRLAAHVAQARDLLTRPEPVGRKLDFLAQEFNREANTLCSKANDVETTRLGIELKAVIDQMREQVQNIE